MIIEDNIDVIIDTCAGTFEISFEEKGRIYYEFEFYPEILN